MYLLLKIFLFSATSSGSVYKSKPNAPLALIIEVSYFQCSQKIYLIYFTALPLIVINSLVLISV